MTMTAYPLIALCIALATAVPALADAPKPVKVSAAQAKGPIFARKDAVKDNGADGPTIDVSLLQSDDKKMQAGVYKAGPSDTAIDSYPEDEFCYLLTGSVKLTSSDGSVIKAKAGEAFAIHKGWKGRWTTPGYTKYYVTYESP
jgi:uncharacterized cupin superfamily protein